MKLAMEKMLIEVEVSFWMFMLRWVMWYAIVRVCYARGGQDVSCCSTNAFGRGPRYRKLLGEQESVRLTVAMVTQPGSRSLGSSKPPENVRIRSVRKAFVELIVRRRMIVACGV